MSLTKKRVSKLPPRAGPPPGLVNEPLPLIISVGLLVLIVGVPIIHLISHYFFFNPAIDNHPVVKISVVACWILLGLFSTSVLSYVLEVRKDIRLTKQFEAEYKRLKEGK